MANNILSSIDVADPIDIALKLDPEISKIMDDILEHESDFETLYAGIKESTEEDEYTDEEFYSDIDTFNAADDESLDFLDMEADEIITNIEDDDSNGELIDMVINGVGID